MKLTILILGLTSLLVSALPVAAPGRTACYAEIVDGVSQEVCTGPDWHPPTDTDPSKDSDINTEETTSTTNTTQSYRRAAEPGKTACYAEKVDGIDTEVCTGSGWQPPMEESPSSTISS